MQCDSLIEILCHVDNPYLYRSVNKLFHSILSNDWFYKYYIEKRFGKDITGMKQEGESYKCQMIRIQSYLNEPGALELSASLYNGHLDAYTVLLNMGIQPTEHTLTLINT